MKLSSHPDFTLMLLVADFSFIKWCKKAEKN